MIKLLGQLVIAVSSIMNLYQINAAGLDPSENENHLLKTYSTRGNEEKSCTTFDENILTKINRLGYSYCQNTQMI